MIKAYGPIQKPNGFQILSQIPSVRARRREDRLAQLTVGLVPTMGALHQGHLALIRQAAQENHRVYVSIYLNPTQFGVNEDFNVYPKTWAADLIKLVRLADEFKRTDTMGQLTTIVAPRTNELYPSLPPTSDVDGHGSFVIITPLSSVLEGASRPVFFRGVATVLTKFFNIVQPDRVYFGQKDIQQTIVVKRMVQDFHIDTEVRVCPTVREENGLAMSSRNLYLGKRRREVAPVLLQALKAVQEAFSQGKRKRADLLSAAFQKISVVQARQRSLPPAKRAMFDVDYISIADPSKLEELEEVNVQEGAIVSGAIIMLPVEDPQDGEDTGMGGGNFPVRLLDNIRLDILSSKLGILSRLS